MNDLFLIEIQTQAANDPVRALSSILRTPLLAGGMAFVAAVLITPFWRWAGPKIGLVDKPDSYRKLHKGHIPLIGGFAIGGALLVPIVTAYFWPGASVGHALRYNFTDLVVLFYGGLLAMALGAADDRWNLRPRYKFLWQIVIAVFAWYVGFRISAVSNPFGGKVMLGLWSLPVTILWFLGCMNAINLLDGLDGLSAGVSLFVCITLGLVSLLLQNFFPLLLAAALAGAILGFLIYNFNPASVFLGDSGTMLLGYLVGAIALIGAVKAHATIALAIPFVALGLPILDTTLAIIRRWAKGLPISAGDRGHIHHALLKLGLSHRKVVLILYSVCILLGVTALMIAAGRNIIAVALLATIAVIALVCVRLFDVVDFRQISDRIRNDFSERRRSERAAVTIEKTIHQLDQAATIDDIWSLLHETFKALELDRAKLVLETDGEDEAMFAWIREVPISEEEKIATDTGYMWSLALKIHHDHVEQGRLEVWKEAEQFPIRNATRLLDRLRLALGKPIAELREEDGGGEEEEEEDRFTTEARRHPSPSFVTTPWQAEEGREKE